MAVYLAYFYGVLVVALMTHIWLRTLQHLEITWFSLRTKPDGSITLPNETAPDQCFGLSRASLITFSMGAAIFVPGIGWFFAMFLTAQNLGIHRSPDQLELGVAGVVMLALFFCFYLVFSACSLLPLLWTRVAITRRKKILVLPWLKLEGDLRSHFLASRESMTNQEVEHLKNMVDLVRSEISSSPW